MKIYAVHNNLNAIECARRPATWENAWLYKNINL